MGEPFAAMISLFIREYVPSFDSARRMLKPALFVSVAVSQLMAMLLFPAVAVNELRVITVQSHISQQSSPQNFAMSETRYSLPAASL